MFFQNQFTLREVDIEGRTIELSEAMPYPITLIVRGPVGDEQPKVAKRDAIAIVRTEEIVTEEVRAQLEGRDDPRPAAFDIWVSVSNRLHDYLLRAIRVLRWRTGEVERGNPIWETGPLYWSDDGQTWRVLPDPPGTLGVEAGIPFLETREDLLASFGSLMNSGVREALAHELFREAWSLRNASPRSSLMLGIAAAEVGFKSLISSLVPSAEWLAFNVPAPPLDRMLAKYLPDLPAKLTFGVRPFVPTQVRAVLQDGAELRNKVAHAGSDPPPRETLRGILEAVKDPLYLLDGYSGHEWAENCVSHNVRELIQSDVQKQKTRTQT